MASVPATGAGSLEAKYHRKLLILMDIHAQYWAGLFDGEGNIYIAKKGRHIKVSVTQKELPILYLLQSIYGGTITRYGVQVCHRWTINGVALVRKFLRDIAPYSIIKGREVMLALKYVQGWKDGFRYHTGGRGGKFSLDPVEIVRCTVIREAIEAERKKPYFVTNYPWVTQVTKN